MLQWKKTTACPRMFNALNRRSMPWERSTSGLLTMPRSCVTGKRLSSGFAQPLALFFMLVVFIACAAEANKVHNRQPACTPRFATSRARLWNG